MSEKTSDDKIIDDTEEDSSPKQSAADHSAGIDEDLEFVEKKPFFKRSWVWITEDKERLGSVIFLFLFVVLIVVLAALGLDLGGIMQSIVDWFENRIGKFGIFFGVFLISIFGNFTVIFPVPYTLALVTVSVRPSITNWDILLMGIFAGAGAAIGETSAWLLGKASKGVVKDGMDKQISRAQNWIDRGLAPLIIFVFAATPLPDDAILIFIGLLGYALWKTLIWCLFGKIFLTASTGFAAKYLGQTSAGKFVLGLFGLAKDAGGVTATEAPVWQSALVWIGSIFIIGIILFADWKDIWNRITRSFAKQKYRALLPDISTDSISKKEKGLLKELKIAKESSFWQCVVKVKEDDYPDYYDFYTTSFVLEKSDPITIPSELVEQLEDNLIEKRYSKQAICKIERVILPKRLQETYDDGTLENLLENLTMVQFKTNSAKTGKNYTLTLLLEEQNKKAYRVRCIGEREALILKSINSAPVEDLFEEVLALTKNLVSDIETIDFVTYAKGAGSLD